MKTFCILASSFALGFCSLQAQSNATNGFVAALPAPTTWQVVEKGPNHQIWQRETYELGLNDSIISRVHRYTELATGMNYQDAQGNWVSAQEQIEPFASGAVARQGQHRVIFANNLNSAGAIDIQTPDGKRLRANVLGLAYYDHATDQSALIAQIQNSQGELLSSNQVLYPDAFKGVQADVRYTYRRGSFEQDVILREQPPVPESFGLKSETTELEVLTEFIDPPEASVVEENKDADQKISWGAMQMGRGKAFFLGSLPGEHLKTDVTKKYFNVGGRHILIEKVPLPKIKPAMSVLPLQSSTENRRSLIAQNSLELPAVPPTVQASGPLKLASVNQLAPGYVLDYIIVSPVLNMTFRSDMTYFVNGEEYVEGLTVIESGTVIKFSDNSAVYPSLDVYGNWVCKTGPYRPAIFTSMDDNTVGETINGSSGVPAPITNTYYFIMDGMTNTSVHDLRFCYAQYGLLPDWTGPIHVWNCQFLNCMTPIANWMYTDMYLHNVLFADCPSGVAFDGGGGSLIGENVTADVQNLIDTNYGPAVNINLTNSIVFSSAAGLWASTVNTNFTAVNPPGTVFQTVGGGAHYLANGSPYCRAGTTGVSPNLLSALAQKTTHPPLVFSGVTFSTPTNLWPQASRDDTNNPDLGYHYDPLDYVFGGCDLFTNLTLNAGTAVGWYEGYGNKAYAGQPYGISVNDRAALDWTGTATGPCWFTRFNTVQEAQNGNWQNRGWMSGIMINGSSASSTAEVNARFTKWSIPHGYGALSRDDWAYGTVRFANCEFYGGGVCSYWGPEFFTNCLFFQFSFSAFNNGHNPSVALRNCTFYNGGICLQRSAYSPLSVWNIQDSAFDGTSFLVQDGLNANPSYTIWGWNAYNAANTNWTTYNFGFGPAPTNCFEPIIASDIIVPNGYNWQTSWLGDFYLPTDSPLIDKGSTTADQLGLFYFTTQTNQVNENITQVDIGYHYVATDANGTPADSNHDGIPNYLDLIPLWQAADLNSQAAGILNISIDQPQNGAAIQ